GVGGTLLGCSLTGRRGVGVDLSPEYIETYRQVCTLENLQPQTAIVGDARNLRQFPDIAGRRFDLVLADPPYGDMMRRPQSGEKKKRTGSSSATPFTPSPHDLGNLPYEQFLGDLCGI